jgi:predicted  nucleic acid-binding Zn-ribbon protein
VAAYDRLRRRRRGVAVVRVERGTCLGCRLTVPTVVLQRARSGTNPNPVQCPSCERMLYVI